VLTITNALRQAIADGEPVSAIQHRAQQAGMTTLFENGCLAVEQGLTSQEELLLVLGIPHAD